MSTVSCNYTLYLEVKKVRNISCSSKSRTNTKDKHFGILEQYSYFWLLNKINANVTTKSFFIWLENHHEIFVLFYTSSFLTLRDSKLRYCFSVSHNPVPGEPVLFNNYLIFNTYILFCTVDIQIFSLSPLKNS
jgi:hypothetical protein